MSDWSKKNYLIPKETLESIEIECEKDLNVTLFNLQYFLGQEMLNMHLISLLCESCYLSYRIKEIVQECYRVGAETKNEKEETELTLSAEKLFVLQALVTGKKDLFVTLRKNPSLSIMEN